MSSYLRLSFPMAFLLLSLAALVPRAHAQAFDAVRLAPLPPGQDGGRIGAAFTSGPQYRGSEERRNRLVPVIDYQWHNGWFAGGSSGLGYNASTDRTQQYGARLTYDFGRDAGGSEALQGMGDIEARPEIGVFYNHFWGAGFAFTSSLRYGAGTQRHGMVVDLGTGWSTPLGSQTRLALGLGLSWVNADYMQDFFGVTAAQSAASGYAVSSPGAGWRNASASLALNHRISRETSVFSALSFQQLMGEARDSVLTRRSSGLGGLVGVAYAF